MSGNQKPLKILVTDGNTRPALAICRSLGSKGHQVIVGDHQSRSLASASKFCRQKCIYPNPAQHPDAFISFLQEYVEFYSIDVLIPVTDVTTIPITNNMSGFVKTCALPFSSYESINRAADKADIFKLAQQLGVDLPETTIIESISDLEKVKDLLNFPLVIKPARSRVKLDAGWLYTSVSYANSYNDLKTKLQALDDATYPLLLQERIVGPGLGVFMCYQQGKPIAAFSHRRIREKPPSGGVSVLRESVALDPLALQFSENLLSTLHWNGVAMVEYKIDERDNRPKLMEINGRFWGSLQLAIDAGVDFPTLLVRSINEIVEPNYKYNLGIKARWFWGDFDALLLRLLKNANSLQLPPNSESKIKYLFNFLKLWEPNMHYEVMKLRDIKPWFFESYQWLKQYFK